VPELPVIAPPQPPRETVQVRADPLRGPWRSPKPIALSPHCWRPPCPASRASRPRAPPLSPGRCWKTLSPSRIASLSPNVSVSSIAIVQRKQENSLAWRLKAYEYGAGNPSLRRCSRIDHCWSVKIRTSLRGCAVHSRTNPACLS
jgi:hypothetical protein